MTNSTREPRIEAIPRPSFAPVRGSLLQRKCACGGTPGPDGECAGCRKKRLQRRATSQAETSSAPPIVGEVLRSPGRPLDHTTRAFMEARFGHDFGRVRVHEDAKAAESARAVSAQAYTVGQDVIFGKGRYAPNTHEGKRLLAHELTHVVQQRGDGAAQTHLTIGETDDAAEHEAESKASSITGDRAPKIGVPEARVHPGTVQRFRGPATPDEQRLARDLSRKILSETGRRAGWRQFWRTVVRRFAIRGAAAAGLALVDGPLPVGDLIALGLTLWTIYEIIQLWEELWLEAERETQPQPEPQTQIQTETQTETETQTQTRPQTQTQTQTRTRDKREDCRRTHPYALICEGYQDREEVVVDFLMNEGYDFDALRDCWGLDSFGPDAIDACDGAPGERWHCSVKGMADEVSVFGCLCCNEDGTTGLEWRGPHWSINLSRRPRR